MCNNQGACSGRLWHLGDQHLRVQEKFKEKAAAILIAYSGMSTSGVNVQHSLSQSRLMASITFQLELICFS